MTPPTLVVADVACSDDHDESHECRYQVAWSINPHMQIGSVDHDIARIQHEAYVRSLATVGAQVIRVPFVHGAYDSVFTKDPALLIERRGQRTAVLAQLRTDERRLEHAARAQVYAGLGFDVIDSEPAPHWEGGDVVMHPSRRSMFLGYGQRSSRNAAAWLEKHTDVEVVPIELRDPYLYHLDMALSVLPDGTALVCADAVSPASIRELQTAPGVRDVVAVERDDALSFALNMVPIGDTIVCGATTSKVASIITGRGYRLFVTSLDQFHLAGGSAACLVAAIHPEPVLVDTTAALEHAPWTSTARSSAA